MEEEDVEVGVGVPCEVETAEAVVGAGGPAVSNRLRKLEVVSTT